MYGTCKLCGDMGTGRKQTSGMNGDTVYY